MSSTCPFCSYCPRSFLSFLLVLSALSFLLVLSALSFLLVLSAPGFGARPLCPPVTPLTASLNFLTVGVIQLADRLGYRLGSGPPGKRTGRASCGHRVRRGNGTVWAACRGRPTEGVAVDRDAGARLRDDVARS